MLKKAWNSLTEVGEVGGREAAEDERGVCTIKAKGRECKHCALADEGGPQGCQLTTPVLQNMDAGNQQVGKSMVF
jgi:hypothetical protein